MEHSYQAKVLWRRNAAVFSDGRYSRGHSWQFDGGADIQASSSPLSVPLPYSVESAVDPEEALVAALSSCHMLFFLHFAGRKGLVVDSYEDDAVGVMEKNAEGKLWMSRVTLRPRLVFAGGKTPTPELLAELHHRAHEECYIANSVRSEVVVEAIPFQVL